MKTHCFKFPDLTTAHEKLYADAVDEGDNPIKIPRYRNIADHGRTGLQVQNIGTHEEPILVHPEDGTYAADIRDNRYPEECPAELEPYLIHPDREYRRHKFAGEE